MTEMKMKVVLVFALIFTVFGWSAAFGHSAELSEKYESTVNPVKVTEETFEAGKSIYIQRCATCHGIDGKGTIPSMPDFTDHEMMENMGEKVMFQKISEGVPGTSMPSWKGILTEEERWMVINYINTMHHRGEETHGGEAVTHEETHPEEESFAAAPEKGVCGPTALLFLATIPVMYQFMRRRE